MNDEQTPALREAVENMRNMRESYDQLAATADLYQQGRTALASAITEKGVPTTADTPLAEMAENVGDIQQVTTTIDGGDMYAAQLFGDGTLWNLYEVLAQMKSQYMGAGHYAALIVCEYYKGYDSSQLQGADAYYTCDGYFYDTSAPLHVWHDAENGKANRWVCFLFATEGARLDITNTAISPRSMYIGGHIGTIEYFVNGCLTDLVCGVEDTDVVDNFLSKTFTQNFGRNIILRGVRNIYSVGTSQNFDVLSNTTGLVDIGYLSDLNKSGSQPLIRINQGAAETLILRGLKRITGSSSSIVVYTYRSGMLNLAIPDLEVYEGGELFRLQETNGLELLDLRSMKRCPNSPIIETYSNSYSRLLLVIVGEMETNLNAKGWNPTTLLADAMKKSELIDNIKNHILARVSDRTGLSQLVFTVSANMYNNIASEQIEWQGETMSLADAFLTKNWLLAGA